MYLLTTKFHFNLIIIHIRVIFKLLATELINTKIILSKPKKDMKIEKTIILNFYI